MNLDSIRACCLALPHASEKVQWENDLLFTIGGKIFAVTPLEPAPFVLTFKPDPEHRLELLEMDGVEPAPYLARAGWVSVRRWDVFRDAEWRNLVSESYRMILAKLPKKLQASVADSTALPSKPGSGATAAKKVLGKSGRVKTPPQSAAAKKSGKKTTATSHKRAGGTKRAGKSASGSR